MAVEVDTEVPMVVHMATATTTEVMAVMIVERESLIGGVEATKLACGPVISVMVVDQEIGELLESKIIVVSTMYGPLSLHF